MSISEATGLLGTILTFGVIFKAMDNINGAPHQLEKVHSTKSSADDHVKRLKKRGKKARIVKKKDGHGKTHYGVYSKVEKKKAKKK